MLNLGGVGSIYRLKKKVNYRYIEPWGVQYFNEKKE
jgi:hypothetical protein